MNILIADDEPLARQRLQGLLVQENDLHTIDQACNGHEVIQSCQQKQYDLILLDIRMPEMDGIETAKVLADFPSPPAVIFITAFDQHALAAFEANAIDYLLKPVRRERLMAAIAKAQVFNQGRIQTLAQSLQPSSEQARKRITALHHGELQSIAVSAIRFFRADQKYVEVVTAEKTFLIEIPLKQLETEFALGFVRVHRNALVALDYIESLAVQPNGSALLKLRNIEHPLAVSRRHLADLKSRMKAG